MAFTLDFTGSVVLVTGVTSGIGQGIARLAARSGAVVAGCGRSSPESAGARKFRSIVETEEEATAFYVCSDIADSHGPSDLVERVVDQLGRIDVVISNAGRNVFTGVETTTLADWTECMNLDLRSHWLLAQAAAPHLRAACESPSGAPDIGKPSFLVNSSNHAYSTIPGCFPYNVAKAGLTGVVQSLAIEWGPLLRAVAVAPGFVETAGNQAWFDRFADSAAERSRTESLHPTGTLGTVDQIGAIFIFLASRYADFVTGTTWVVDGGRSALMQDGGKDYA